MSAQHTPGPWHVLPGYQGPLGAAPEIVQTPNGDIVAEVWWTDMPEGDQVANARLIAAAPALLVALCDLLDAISIMGENRPKFEHDTDVYDRAFEVYMQATATPAPAITTDAASDRISAEPSAAASDCELPA